MAVHPECPICLEPVTNERHGIKCRRPCAHVFHQRCIVDHLRAQRQRQPEYLGMGVFEPLPETCPMCRVHQPVFDRQISTSEIKTASRSITNEVFPTVIEENQALLEEYAQADEAAHHLDEEHRAYVDAIIERLRVRCRDLIYDRMKPHILPGCKRMIRRKAKEHPNKYLLQVKVKYAVEQRQNELRTQRIRGILAELKPSYERNFQDLLVEIIRFGQSDPDSSVFQDLTAELHKAALKNALKKLPMSTNIVEAVNYILYDLKFGMRYERETILAEIADMFVTDEVAQRHMDELLASIQRRASLRTRR